MKTLWHFLMLCMLAANCKISAVNYAQGDIKIISQTKTEVDQRPAVEVGVHNNSEDAIDDIMVTVKAKKQQADLEVVDSIIEVLHPDETVHRMLIFHTIKTHDEYDFLTFAVKQIKRR